MDTIEREVKQILAQAFIRAHPRAQLTIDPEPCEHCTGDGCQICAWTGLPMGDPR